jgi:penicillin-binding protein 1A
MEEFPEPEELTISVDCSKETEETIEKDKLDDDLDDDLDDLDF